MPTNHSWHRKQCWLLLPPLPTLEARKTKDTELKQQLCAIWRDSISSARLLGSRERTTEFLLKINEKDNEHISGVRSSAQACLPQHADPHTQYRYRCWGHVVPLSLLSPTFALVTVKTANAGFIALVMWALPSPEKATVKPSSYLRSPGMGKPSLLASVWDPTAKNSITRTANYWALWSTAASQSMTLLSKLYLDVSAALFLVLYNTGFGSDSVMRYTIVIHKQLH